MKRFTLLISFSLIATACLPTNVQIPQSPLLKILERKSGLIAYIGADENIYISDQGGGSLVQFTKDAFSGASQVEPYRIYLDPTWSRDGSQLAFFRRSSDGFKTTSALMVINTEDDSVKQIYTSETEHPFYLYWNPNNKSVSFLSTTISGQSFMLQSVPATGGDRVIIDTGSPYYWSWAPDGSVMVVHTGQVNSSTPEHLAFLRVNSEIIEDKLDAKPASFQAPAWSPDGNRILLSRINDKDQKELALMNGSGSFQEAIGTFDNNVSFAWSNDSNLFAYIAGDVSLTSGTIGTLHVMDITKGTKDIFQDDKVVAFFWSPDGTKLAYFKPFLSDSSSGSDSSGPSSGSGQNLFLELDVLDIASGKSRVLFSFQPTGQFANILPYYDQYHQSATIWSPDNNNLVISFLNSDSTPDLAIVAASGQLQPRILAGGYLAFWSWK